MRARVDCMDSVDRRDLCAGTYISRGSARKLRELQIEVDNVIQKQEGKVLFKILGVAAGLVFVAFGIKERHELSNLQSRGERAVVEPVTEYTEFSKSGSSTYTAEIRFVTEKGRQISMKHSFPEEVLEDFKAGRPVEVVYLPNNPQGFVFANQETSWTLEVIGGVVILAALILA